MGRLPDPDQPLLRRVIAVPVPTLKRVRLWRTLGWIGPLKASGGELAIPPRKSCPPGIRRARACSRGDPLPVPARPADYMPMASSLPFHTAEMVRALIDESRPAPRYETVYGELLVTPSPGLWHQELVGRLYRAVGDYVRREPVGHVFAAPADISWGRPDVLVQPDVFVVPLEEARTLRWSGITRLILAVEVLSPSSVRADRFTKRKLYQDRGTQTYWMVDPAERLVEVWAPGAVFPRTEHETLRWRLAGASTDLVLDLDVLFAPL
jgi:Uma2 family endonuclease